MATKIGWTGTEMMNYEFKEPPALVKELLWEEDNVIILGDAKTGKSLLSLQLALSLVSGEPFLDELEVVNPVNVLYVQAEGKMSDSCTRYKKMTKLISTNHDRLRWLYVPRLPLDQCGASSAFIDVVTREFGDFKPKVIFIDPLYMLASKGSLKDDDIGGLITGCLNELKCHYNAAIVLNHHEHRGKTNREGDKIEEGDNSIFGSFVWKAWPDHVLHFKKTSKTARTLCCNTQRSGSVIEERKLFFNQPDPLFFEILDDSVEHKSKILLNIIKLKGDAVSFEKMCEVTNDSPRFIKKVIRKLLSLGAISKCENGFIATGDDLGNNERRVIEEVGRK